MFNTIINNIYLVNEYLNVEYMDTYYSRCKTKDKVLHDKKTNIKVND